VSSSPISSPRLIVVFRGFFIGTWIDYSLTKSEKGNYFMKLLYNSFKFFVAPWQLTSNPQLLLVSGGFYCLFH